MDAVIRSSLLDSIPGIRHGFGSIRELVPRPLARTWDDRARKTQVHSARVCCVRHPGQLCGEVDGLTCQREEIPLAIVHADCVPVLLARRDGKFIAAVHGGWRGILAGVIDSVWISLAAVGESAAQWVAAVGPAIGPCCYEVGDELPERFAVKFPHIPARAISPTSRRLDLGHIAELHLRALGISAVERLTRCTCCEQRAGEFFFQSYRRGDRGSQQFSGLVIAR
jgi:YfiH family protein